MKIIVTFLLIIFTTSAVAQDSDGQALYQEYCASCHGENLEGQNDWQAPDENGVRPAPPHDETGHTWHHPYEMLFYYTKLGGEGFAKAQNMQPFPSGMPAFGEQLSDEQIDNILRYIESSWPAQIIDMREERFGD